MSEISKLDRNLSIKKIDKDTVVVHINDNEMLMTIVGQFDQNLKDLSNHILLAKKQNDYNKIIEIDKDRRIIIDQIFSKGIKTLSEEDINIIKIIAEENENLISEISVATTKSIEKANKKMRAIKGYNF